MAEVLKMDYVDEGGSKVEVVRTEPKTESRKQGVFASLSVDAWGLCAGN
jgi:hypothetical protein